MYLPLSYPPQPVSACLFLAHAKAPHAADERGRPAHAETNQIALVGARVHDHAGFDRGQRRAFVLRNAQLRFDDRIGVQRGVDGRK